MRHSTHLSERAAHQAVEWAAAEGWNPGIDDAERFLAVDPEAFMATEAGGEIVGTVSCALYGERYAFIGFYIVRSDIRGQGVGTALFDRALERGGERVVGLDGVLEQQAVYASLGFELAYRNERWRGTGGGTRPPGLAGAGFDTVHEYDTAIFGADREAFLRTWLDREEGHVLVAEGMRGYAVSRRCRDGMKIGPLFAEDPETAAWLLAGMRATAGEGTPVFLDVPHANPAALELAKSALDAPVFETARMYRNGRPPEDVTRVYGVTTFELG